MDGGTRPYRESVSLAVWDVPLPVVAGERFAIKAGAKSAAGSTLAGRGIEVCDAAGAAVAAGRLGSAPLPDTDALYWTALEVPAPAREGVAEFTVRFVPGAVQPAHEAAVSRFCVAVTRKPAHRLTVDVSDRDTGAPLSGVEIRIGAFHARTDGAGRAEVRLCAGDHQLLVWKSGHDAPPRPLAIKGDTAVEIAMVHVPEEHPDARWVM